MDLGIIFRFTSITTNHLFIIFLFMNVFFYTSFAMLYSKHSGAPAIGDHRRIHNQMVHDNNGHRMRHPVNGNGWRYRDNAHHGFPSENMGPQHHSWNSISKQGGGALNNVRFLKNPPLQPQPPHPVKNGGEYMSIPLYVHQMLEQQKSEGSESYSFQKDAAVAREFHQDDFWRHNNNYYNFGAGSIPSITIHSSFKRGLPSSQNEVSSKSPEVNLDSEKKNSVSSLNPSQSKKNWIWWVYGSRTLPFQTRGLVIPIGDGSYKIVLDDSEADVTFETIVEVEENEPEEWEDEMSTAE